jgi:hypothetical protein
MRGAGLARWRVGNNGQGSGAGAASTQRCTLGVTHESAQKPKVRAAPRSPPSQMRILHFPPVLSLERRLSEEVHHG